MAHRSAALLAQWLLISFLQGAPEPKGFSLGISELLIILVGVAVVFGIVLAIVMIAKKMDNSGKKRCPYCAELIQAQAQICRFCNRPVPLQ